MKALLLIALLSFEWYGPGAGAAKPTPPQTEITQRAPKKETSATYRHYRGYNELRIEDSYGKRKYQWLGPPQYGWMYNPYVPRPRKRLSR